MKLNNVLQYINLALNYPSLTYQDISLYFDMAISELNTTLHTSIPSVSEMIKAFERKMSKDSKSSIRIASDPETSDYTITAYATVDNMNAASIKPKFCYVFETGKFYVQNLVNRNAYEPRDTLVGVYFKDATTPVFYEANIMADEVFWVKTLENPILDCDLSSYLPEDWVLLWLIPYVCFKYTVRDGGTATVFADELSQGFQQLQESYDVPSRVVLATYADKEAYTELVEKYIPNLNITVRTRAIYDTMKHSRALNADYGSMYDRGGFND